MFEQLLKVKPFIDWTAFISTEKQLEIVFKKHFEYSLFFSMLVLLSCDLRLLIKSPRALRVGYLRLFSFSFFKPWRLGVITKWSV